LFAFTTIADYQQQLISGSTTCVEAVNYYLGRIVQAHRLNAFVDVYTEESIARAKSLDAKQNRGEVCGKLLGVVVAIKDVICYKDHRITASSGILRDFVSVYNSTAVEHLLQEDAIIIGSCNCDEFAMGSTNEHSVYGRVLNALDENKVPGGSSGGSAVAVQAGLCMVSLGSDTGGSVRQPADFCGITGIKPSYGCISRHGLIAYASSFDQVGIFSNNVSDARAVLEVIQGKDNYDSTVSSIEHEKPEAAAPDKRYRIAVFKNALDHNSLDPEIKNAIYKLTGSLQQQGHLVAEIEFNLIDFIVPAYYVLTTAEASSNLSRYDGVRYGYRQPGESTDIATFYKKTRSHGFGKEVKRRIMLGTFVLSEGYYDAYFTKAQQIRRLLADQTADIFRSYDAVFMPTVPCTAFDAGSMPEDPVAMYLADIYTVYANLTGTPAISLPLFKHSNGMPFGLQVIAAKHNEVPLLQLSEMLMNGYKMK
jgi:aspartyl-tRNA(Asn)/glutamyl-tRNA(Gln) amidotransferase subunit A